VSGLLLQSEGNSPFHKTIKSIDECLNQDTKSVLAPKCISTTKSKYTLQARSFVSSSPIRIYKQLKDFAIVMIKI